MFSHENIASALRNALPVILGYIAIGLPCGILSASIGMNVVQVLILSLVFYSGAGQFMIPNMWLAGAPLASIIASVSLVNTRQVLYSASFAPWVRGASKGLAFWFAATVTDECFGVNLNLFLKGGWSVERATLVNAMAHLSWTASCVVGVLIGNALALPLPIASFAMTSIFICLLVTQKATAANVVAAACAMAGVLACKAAGLAGPAILVGALLGVACGMGFAHARRA